MPDFVSADGNLLAIVDTETTGLDIRKSEIVELCVLPVTPQLELHKEVLPFHLKIKPDYPEDVDHNALSITSRKLSEICLNGVSQDEACDLLNKWFERLNLPLGKKIMPIGHNFAVFDRAMLVNMLGAPNYDQIFHHHIRDTMSMAIFLNDRATAQYDPPPFKYIKQSEICKVLRITQLEAHTAMDDCLTCLEMYKRMLVSVTGLF